MPSRLDQIAVAAPDRGAAAGVDPDPRGAQRRPVSFRHPADSVGALVELEEV